MGEKPTAAMVLSIIGGIFVLLGGLFIAFLGSIIGSLNIVGGGAASSTLLVLGLVGVIFGIIMAVGGVMMYKNPQSHTMWGAIVLVLSIFSWVVAVGGLFIGFLLGLIGGILALVFKPSMAPSMMPGQQMGSMPMGSMTPMGTAAPMGQMGTTCKNCGASIPAGAMRCPSCGASV